MPYSQAQNKLFRAAAHNPDIAKAHGMAQHAAAKLASEGVKRGAVKKTILHKGG